MARDREVVRRDEPRHRQVHEGKVVARTYDDATGDKARDLARRFHGGRKPGDSHWYEVRDAGQTGTHR